MRRDFDYVSMDDYQSDMKESADRAVNAIETMRKRAEEAERLLGLVLVSIEKEVRISYNDLARLRPGESMIVMEQAIDHATGEYVVRAKWRS